MNEPPAIAPPFKSGLWSYAAAVLISLYIVQRDAPALLLEKNVRHLFDPVQAQIGIQGLQFSFSALTVLWPLFLAAAVLLEFASRVRVQSLLSHGQQPPDSVIERLYLTRSAEHIVLALALVAAAFHFTLFVIAAFLFSQGPQFEPRGYNLTVVVLQGLTTTALIAAVLAKRRVAAPILRSIGLA